MNWIELTGDSGKKVLVNLGLVVYIKPSDAGVVCVGTNCVSVSETMEQVQEKIESSMKNPGRVW